MNEQEVKKNLREAIDKFCMLERQLGHCVGSSCECEFCPVNRVYGMAEDFEEEEIDEI